MYGISIGEDLFDWFFNSERGYRGTYYQSPQQGQKANEQFILAAMPKLLKCRWRDGQFDNDYARDSLTTESAKVWLPEIGKGCHDCKECSTGEWRQTDNDSELENGRWECKECSNGEAGWGRRAPLLDRIRIFGAFLNERREKHVPPNKVHRAQHIHDCGWS